MTGRVGFVEPLASNWDDDEDAEVSGSTLVEATLGVDPTKYGELGT